MRFDLFRRLQKVPAIYFAEAPLFALTDSVQPIVPSSFRSEKSGIQLNFAPRDTHYMLSGGPWPETVALLPLPKHPDLFVFQQSDGQATAFYGMLRLAADHPGFGLFSPEAAAAAALDAAVGEAAPPTTAGYRFTSRSQLLRALIPVALEAPASAWDVYRLV